MLFRVGKTIFHGMVSNGLVVIVRQRNKSRLELGHLLDHGAMGTSFKTIIIKIFQRTIKTKEH
jgi:hypothetical protein